MSQNKQNIIVKQRSKSHQRTVCTPGSEMCTNYYKTTKPIEVETKEAYPTTNIKKQKTDFDDHLEKDV